MSWSGLCNRYGSSKHDENYSWQSLVHSFSFCVRSPRVAFFREAMLSLIFRELPFTPISFAVTDDQNHRHTFYVFMFYKNINIKLRYFYTYILFPSPKYYSKWSACTQEGVQFSN